MPQAANRMISRLGWLCFIALGACSNSSDKPPGTLVLPFELGNGRSCDALGVKTVRAELDDMAYVAEAPCSNGQVRFSEIPAGTYHVQMYGEDASGLSIMDSYTSGDVVVNVVGDQNTVVNHPAITLTAAPAHLLVRWNFGFGTCKGVGIDTFAVKVWHSSGDDLLLSSSLSCLADGDGKDQYRTVPDPDRRLSGDAVGEVTVQPLDNSGVEVGTAVDFKFQAPGPGRDIKLSLTCDDGACTSSGKPD